MPLLLAAQRLSAFDRYIRQFLHYMPDLRVHESRYFDLGTHINTTRNMHTAVCYATGIIFVIVSAPKTQHMSKHILL